ncbi:MAG: hypothetical protein JO168_00925 [Solirubrobacterales bacterium]|nr:hypothetical protein [Solirubrobacterales bacterium]MBV9714896.1 hypothetical protein [Solirubrobacterales bacterium]
MQRAIDESLRRLVDSPPEARDLRWHVAAAYLGDLSALASARLVGISSRDR